MRLSRADLKRRINGEVEIRYDASGLTSFAGLELIGRFFRRLGLRELLRQVARRLPRNDFGAVEMVFVILTLLIITGRPVRHCGEG